MAISITALDPIKNAAAVPVGSDITLTLKSDTLDLDVNKVEFLINGISIKASSYYGVNNTEIDVSFFAKRKIKYDTRRYGQDDVRYGQRDVFPSSFRYGQRYICTIRVEDIGGLTFEENFSFTIEEGIFYNENPSSSFYHPQTQAIGNYAPPWAKIRYDKYSNFQQLVNAPGQYVQEIEDSMFNQISSYFVQTADLNDMSTLYKVEPGGDFEFQTTVLDDGTTLQIPPDVSAIEEITRFFPTAEFQNDVKSFYNDKLPTRLNEISMTIEDLVLTPKRLANDIIFEVEKKLERDGHIAIIIEDAVRFTKVKDGRVSFSICRVIGESRERKKETEDLVILDNDTYFTSKLWRKIESIQFINLPDNSNLHYTIDHARPLRSFVPDSFSHINTRDEEKTSFWKLEDTAYGSVLQQWTLLAVDPNDVVASLGEKDLVTEFELLDIDGSTNLNLIDIDTDPFNNLIYGIDNDYLYTFDKREDYSTAVKQLPETNGSSDFVLDIDGDELGREDSVKRIGIIGLQKTVSKEIAQYRLSVSRPDSVTEYILSDGSTTTDPTLASSLGTTTGAQFRTATLFYDLDILGDYVITLEAVYKDGTTGLDAKIVRLHKKNALSKYKLERLFDEAIPVRIFVDFDQQLKVLDNENILHTLEFARDNMLIDYSNSVIYFNENYDEVEVE